MKFLDASSCSNKIQGNVEEEGQRKRSKKISPKASEDLVLVGSGEMLGLNTLQENRRATYSNPRHPHHSEIVS